MTDIETMLSRLTYKPGWRIEHHKNHMGDLTIAFSHHAPDANGIAPEAEVMCKMTIPGDYLSHCDAATILDQVFHMVRGLEEHELKEWLRIDGKPLREPHPVTS